MDRPTLVFLLGCLVALTGGAPAYAQDAQADAAANARYQIGPLALTPSISLTNLGRDTNVLNQTDHPRGDFTATLVPGVRSWLHAGRARLSGQTSVELLYFQKISTQRSFGVSHAEQLDLLFVRLTPYVGGGYLTTYQRPNAEVDARVQQTAEKASIGTVARVGARTTIEIAGGRSRLRLGTGTLLGINLAQQLDRTTDSASASLKVVLTPLTTFGVRTDVLHDRFPFAPVRSTNSVSVLPGLELKPSALISGSAEVGYRLFKPISGELPRFSGVVAAIAVDYVMHDTTKIGVTVNRNVDYSFETTEPYYVATGAGLSLTQRLGRDWDGVVRGLRQHLDYQSLLSATPPTTPSRRRDFVRVYGAGIGYRLANAARVGFNVDHTERRSVVAGRSYTGFRFGGSFTYGY